MLNRRTFLGLLSLSAGGRLAAKNAKRLFSVKPPQQDLATWVNPAIGTGGHGHTFPGATVPFGAVQLSPDTYNQGWDWSSGYYLTDTSIMGFSHAHLSGTGAGDLLDFLIAPRVGELKLQPGTREQPEEGYRSRFSHSTEKMEPGYYSVMLDTPGILAELTATERTGIHRYTFPQSDSAHFVVDLHHAMLTPVKKTIIDADIKLVGSDTILGGRRVRKWAPHRQIYFAMQFSRPWFTCDLYSGDAKQTATELQGENLKAVPHFRTIAGEKLLVKVGISMVSSANALLNLQHEHPGWDFDNTRRNAKQAWNNELARLQITGGSENDRKIFYTSAYHMMCAPTLADDVNGQYRGMDQEVHVLKPGQHNYSTYSLWDTYRALHPSFTLWQQERVPQFVNCLIAMAEESPGGMPIWPLQGNETFTMTGYHSATVIAEACVKKFPGIDWQRAYKSMRKRNMDDDYRGLVSYRQLGYIPADEEKESVSKVLEYNYNDWACSKVAEAVGRHDDAKLQRERSLNYRHLFDPDSQFLRARLRTGTWTPNFDPRSSGHGAIYRDYTESNAWQTAFGVQHDVLGHIKLFGGPEPYVLKIDALYNTQPGMSNETLQDVTGSIGQYVHGNEPSHHILFLYTYAGQPWKTQKWVREVVETQYRNDPDGLCGNEDCGQMSAWYLMAALGLYAVDPISGTYILTAPHFEKASVQVADGQRLVIEAHRKSPSDRYIQSVALNGAALDKLWIKHEDIANGGTLRFEIGPEPNFHLASSPASAPPSLTS
ncbi:MAG: GH92 family glycosyl hydrolase [Acidobacteriota bacterium]